MDRGWGWGAHILPYLEESSIFQQIDFKTNIEANVSPNKDLRVVTLQVFRCPSDSVELPFRVLGEPLRRRGGHYGLATLCVGVGQGQAALFER